jgi:DNA polymerase bacteriophage-type
MTHLHLDFETRSTVDIRTAGLDNYARNAEVLMLGWAIGDGEVNLWVPAEGQPVPPKLHGYLFRSDVKKVAWHAQFERAILLHCMKIDLDPAEFIDPKVMARYASLSASLEQAGEFFKLDESLQKDKEGKRLIQKFCIQRRGKFNDWKDHPEDWEKFKQYCRRDVVAERELLHVLEPFTLPSDEEKLRVLDAKINETGLPVDVDFVLRNRGAVLSEKEQLFAEMRQLTGLENPNSIKQLLPWLKANGYPFGSLGAKRVEKALEGM